MLNDKLGTTEQKRDVEIIYVKNKKGEYDDLENAMFDAKGRIQHVDLASR